MRQALPTAEAGPEHEVQERGAQGAMPDLAQRRRAARRVAWGIAAVAALLYLVGFFVQGG